jgi:hypothetical protein
MLKDALDLVSGTPWPTLAMLIGFIMLSVGFGLRISVVFNVEQLNKTYAKIIGIALLMIGLAPHATSLFSDNPQTPLTTDPWLIYYVSSMLFFVALCFTILKFTVAESQARAMKIGFLLVGALVSLAVLWRVAAVYFYISTPGNHDAPFDLYQKHSYFPYFVIVGAGILVILWIIHRFTQAESNNMNRVRLYEYFASLTAYLIFCRFAWELADLLARKRMPQ